MGLTVTHLKLLFVSARAVPETVIYNPQYATYSLYSSFVLEHDKQVIRRFQCMLF